MLTTRLKPVLLKRKGVALGVWGEAGIGKSHTLRDLFKGLPCHSLRLHSTVQLSTLAQRLMRPKKLPSWAERTLARLEKNESVEEANVLAALGATLSGLAPFVLHLEDIHEADAERLEFLRVFARMIGRTKGVGLVVTSRTEPPEPFTAMRLEPLPRADADKLLEHEVSARLPKEALEWIYGKAAGNPLYTLEYLRFLSRQGFLWNDGRSWHWRTPETNLMPVTVEALIELTLSSVQDKRLETVLQTKAFLPLEAGRELLQNVTGLSQNEVAEAALDLEQRGIFSKENFAHPLYREVTLKHLSNASRQQLARRALEVLQDNPLEAARFVADANLENAKALELLQRAARVAQETENKVQAGRLLAQASEYATGEEKGDLALEAAQLLDGLDYVRTLELAVTASSHLSDPSEALFLQANILALQNKYEAMQEVVNRLPAAAKQGRAWLERYIKLLHNAGKHEERLQVWEAHPERDECAGTTAHYVGWAYVHKGDFEAATRLVRQWLTKAQLSENDKMSLGELQAAIAFYQGNYSEAEKAYSDVLNLRHKDTPPQAVANMLRNRSMSRLGLGLYPESLPDLQEALNIYSEIGNSMHYAQTLVMTSYIHLELGDFDKTEEVLLEALEIFRRAETQAGLVGPLAQLSSLYLEGSQPTHPLLATKYASEAFDIALKLQQDFDDIVARHALSRAKTATGRASEGLELAEKALERAERLGFFEAVLSCTHAKGLAHQALGQVPEAREMFETVCCRAQEHGLVLETNKYGLELDRLNHDVKSARKRMQWFEERGLLGGVNLAKRYFPELAEQPESVTTKDLPRLEVLGVMQIRHEGRSVKVQGRKRQELFALLLEARMAGRAEVSRLDFFDVLYPDMDETKALGSLKQLVYTLRLELGESVIKTTTNGYALGEITSDAETFLQTSDTSLWRGCYLEELALEMQEGVADSLYLLLFDKARALLDTDSKEAARVARFLLEADPYDADYLIFTLQALRQSDNHRTLRRVYEEAKKHFAEVGETLPQSWLAFLETRVTA